MKADLDEIKTKFSCMIESFGISYNLHHAAYDIFQNGFIQTESITPVHDKLISSQRSSTIKSFSGEHNRTCCVDRMGPDRGMSCPYGTPRKRPWSRRRCPSTVRSMYADLLIQQLLARAQTESNSSDSSNNHPETNIARHNNCSRPNEREAGFRHGQPFNVSTNGGSQETTSRQEAPSDAMPGSDVQRACSVPSTCSTTSSGRSVPDFNQEIVSRLEHYSDFTIDRQKKIDDAAACLTASPDGTSSSSSIPNSRYSEPLRRCVEGSNADNSVRNFITPIFPAPLITTDVPNTGRYHADSQSHPSSDGGEFGIPSDLGSNPLSNPSNKSSHGFLPLSNHPSTSSISFKSKNSHQKSNASSHRSSNSSKRSHLSSHPLASSTLLSDPSNTDSLQSGSVYTWSLENGSDENLEQSFLRSSAKKRRKDNRPHCHRKLSSERRTAKSSKGTNTQNKRPETTIGADSSHENSTGSLHLTHLISAIETPVKQRFGGTLFENTGQQSTSCRTTSLPRSSTHFQLDTFPKYSSSPELCSLSVKKQLQYATPNGQTFKPSNPLEVKPMKEMSSNCISSQKQPHCARPNVLGKSSSTSDSSYLSQCSQCNPRSTSQTPSQDWQSQVEALEDILTNSAYSFPSSGAHPPCNSCDSPEVSVHENTIREAPPDHTAILKRTPLLPASQQSLLFKVPFSPARNDMLRKSRRCSANNDVDISNSRHVPCTPFGRPNVRRHSRGLSQNHHPTVSDIQSGAVFRTPKISDRKSLAQKIKHFSLNYRRDKEKDGCSFKTLARF